MNLISKYNISEKDLFQLGVIESKKKSSGLFEKEKLKAASLKILKPYNVKFLDLGGLLNEIKDGNFDVKYSQNFSQSEKDEAYRLIQENSNVSNFYRDWWNKKSKNKKYIIIGGAVVVLMIIGSLNSKSTTTYESTNDSYTPNSQADYCAYCNKAINGSGYEQLGKKYCKIDCYVYDNE